MSRMNAGIILQSRQPDFVNALARGHAAGREALKSDVFREHGAAAINGDQEAQNALASFDPTLSQGIQRNNQLMTHADENQSFNREKMTMLRSDHARKAQAIVAQMSATERKQTADRLNGVLMGAIPLYKAQDEAGYNSWLQKNGLDPQQYTFRDFPSHAAMVTGTLDALADPKPSAAEAQITRLMETGMDRDTAIGIADGRYVTSRDPVTQEAVVLDKSTGQPISARTQQANAGTTELQSGQPATVDQETQAPVVTNTPSSFGAAGAGAGLVNTIADAVGTDVPFPEVQETQARFGVMRENLTRLISEGYQRQPPAFLMKGIQDLIPQAGKLTQGASGAQTDLQALHTNFETEIAAIQKQLSGRRMSPNTKIKLEGRLSALTQSRDLVRRELDGFSSTPTGNKTTTGGVSWEVIE